MKLLLDQNLSPRLARTLEVVYPGSSHGAFGTPAPLLPFLEQSNLAQGNALGIVERVPPPALKGRANGSPFQGSAVEMEGAV